MSNRRSCWLWTSLSALVLVAGAGCGDNHSHTDAGDAGDGARPVDAADARDAGDGAAAQDGGDAAEAGDARDAGGETKDAVVDATDGGDATPGGLVVAFASPPPGKNLCNAMSSPQVCVLDADAATAGWQGSLLAHITGGGQSLAGVAVTFTVGAATVGTSTSDANGNAQVTGVTILDGPAVTITVTTGQVPGFGVGSATITVVVDTALPMLPPTNLTAAVADRRQTSFQLSWTAPGDGGQPVRGYRIRAATAPITESTFDAVGTLVIPYSGTPAAPSTADGALAKNLLIETGYYFAVAATDGAGNRGPIAATSTATSAAFMVNTLAGLAMTDRIGYSVDGTGDFGSANSAFAADNFSDLVVGNFSLGVATAGAAKVYLYFGSAAGYPATPSVTISGTANGFGFAVVNAGDVDGDGLDDIAVSSPNDGNGKVFIFSRKSPAWSSNGAWPATLTDTQANYVITADASYSGTTFGQRLASAQGFSMAGASDLIIGTPGYASKAGQTLIVKGGSAFTSVALPSATATVVVSGSAANDLFGIGLLDIGTFAGSPTTWLLSSATGAGGVYAFRNLGAGTSDVSAAMDSALYAPASARYGSPLSLIGPLSDSTLALAVGAIGSFVDLHLVTAATGPLQGAAGAAPMPAARFVDPAAGNSWGVLTLGTGIPGKNTSVSLIGNDTLGDLVMAGQTETDNPLYIVSGADLTTMAGMVDVTKDSTKVVRVRNRLPADWIGFAGASVVPDSNGDGYADFTLGEFTINSPGRVAVFY